MGRRAQPRIRAALLDACTDYALDQGLPERLAPIAAATGTSSRMLIYHFGTRDNLLREVLGRARERQRAMFGDLLRPRDDQPYIDTLRHAWSHISGDRGRPFLAMFGRLREDAEQHLWPGFREVSTTDWLDLLEDGMRGIGQPGQGTLALAVIRGLIMDLESTGARARVDHAFEEFLGILDASGSR